MSTELKDRDFTAILNEWTDALLQENSNAELREIPLILRLGLLGQKLIFEAHTQGVDDTVKMVKETSDG